MLLFDIQGNHCFQLIVWEDLVYKNTGALKWKHDLPDQSTIRHIVLIIENFVCIELPIDL